MRKTTQKLVKSLESGVRTRLEEKSRNMVGELRRYANAMVAMTDGKPVGQYYQVLLDKGMSFETRISTYDGDDLERWHRLAKPKVGECFYNAQQFAEHHEGVKYYEGLAVTFMPTIHAWNVMPDGSVVDFTYDARDKMFRAQKMRVTPVTYLGVEIPEEFVTKMAHKLRRIGPVIQRYYMGMDEDFVID